MKKIKVAKFLGLSAAIILLFNLLFTSYQGFFNLEKNTEKDKSGLSINTLSLDDDNLFNFEKEAPDEEDFDDKHEFLPYGLNFAKYDLSALLSQVPCLKKYKYTVALKQSLPRWLLVRHILI
ncbi:MAG: hypothetical protein K0R65_511 [Crocinitomicaceae bacterium]|jgi:hypothetical protein|nr:hypothetical protein [Crocinitomicaceae bacterium]